MSGLVTESMSCSSQIEWEEREEKRETEREVILSMSLIQNYKNVFII